MAVALVVRTFRTQRYPLWYELRPHKRLPLPPFGVSLDSSTLPPGSSIRKDERTYVQSIRAVESGAGAGNMATFTPVTHVIFDLDGTLLDTEIYYIRAEKEVCKKYGKKYTSDLRANGAGMLSTEYSAYIVSELDLPITPEEFYKDAKALYRKLFPCSKLLPGAERLIYHFHQHGIPMAVATSSSREHIDLKFTNHKAIFSLMSHVVSGTSDPEIHHGKPAPDIFLVCASRFPDSPSPEKVLVFEDAPNGVLSGRAAGMQVVMIPEPYISEEKRAGATLVLNSLEEFKPELFGLPPF